MTLLRLRSLTVLPWLALVAGAALAQGNIVPSAGPVSATSATAPRLATLVGRWVRPDGGYVITIKAVDSAGKLDASYANPSPLPFYTAEAAPEGTTFKLFFELRAGGYNGSTYSLVYDAPSDQLKGVYFQAVAQQRFEVTFARAK